jgi:hypothetical protein
VALVARVTLTRHLFTFFPHLEGAELVVDASTVAEVVQRLEEQAPGFTFYVCDELGRLRQHVNIFVGDSPIWDRRTLSDRVEADTPVFIAQALSGG